MPDLDMFVWQASTTIHEQKLICPLPIEVSAMEEVVILDNLEVFRHNGFHFHVDEDAPPMRRLKVSTTHPYYALPAGRCRSLICQCVRAMAGDTCAPCLCR